MEAKMKFELILDALKEIVPYQIVEDIKEEVAKGVDGLQKRVTKVLLPHSSTLQKENINLNELSHAIQIAASLLDNKELPMRVDVYCGDNHESLGQGNYVENVTVYYLRMPNGSLVSLANAEEEPEPYQIPQGAEMQKTIDNPKIILDNGDVVYGCQVWWNPAGEGNDDQGNYGPDFIN